MRDPKRRNDRWTAARQIAFLDTLARTRSVTTAAAAAGMSRESAHRLRARHPHSLFAALWDMALAPPLDTEEPALSLSEGHTTPLTDGRLARILGNHYRRETANSSSSAGAAC